MTELLHMGGHGVYVWSAYALSFAALVGLGVWPLVSLRATIRRLRERGGRR
ncbi:MAG: heme exporter protein CcmD [Gammaproteobacteria bacterium]|nr:heme exporter protein CcmD [Gammaproteobacteria bacterium]